MLEQSPLARLVDREVGEPPDRVEKSPSGFSLVRAADLKPRPHDWLISGLFERDSLLLIFGPPAVAKTFAVLDMAASVATGRDYHGRPVKKGPVVYIAGEGQNGLARRLMAWRIANKTDLDGCDLFVSRAPAAMLDTTNLSTVMAAIDATGCRPAMVVLDTIARNYGPGDENSTQDMTGFVAACDQIRTAYGCTVALVHHTGHGDQQRGRGSSVLNGAIDAAYCLSRDADGPVVVENTKMKDADRLAPFAFKFETVQLGFENEDGTPATSAVLAPCDPPDPRRSPASGKHQQKALAILRDLLKQRRQTLEKGGRDPEQARVTVTDWRTAAIDAGIPRQRWYDAKSALIEKGGVIHDAPYVRPA